MKSILRIFSGNENALYVTKALLDSLNIKVTSTSIARDLHDHPEYPSLLSISDILTRYGVDNVTIKVDKERIIDIPPPFLTKINSDEDSSGLLIVVKRADHKNLTIYDPRNEKWVVERTETFLKNTDGIVLIAEPTAAAGEKDYPKKRKEERLAKSIQYVSFWFLPFCLVAGCTISQTQAGEFNVFSWLFSLLTLAGSIVCILLLAYEIDQYLRALQHICKAGKNMNCAAVLKSDAAKIWGIPWSMIGFGYFMGILISLLVHGMNDMQHLSILAWLSLAASGYIFYSIYYQWKVVKQWCPLCLSVQTILLLQCIVAAIAGWHRSLPIGNALFITLIQMAAAMAIPFIAAFFSVPYIKRAREGEKKVRELQKIKRNLEIFETLLSKQKKVSETADGLGIRLGNPAAANKIIKVCNPYCSPCALAHKPVDQLLDEKDVEVQLIFTVSNEDGDVKTAVVKHFLAIADKNDQTLLKQSLDDWYLSPERSYEVFARKHPLNGELKLQSEKINAMHDWCNKNGITHTPTFFINGYQLPGMYNIGDVNYFIDELNKKNEEYV